MYHKNSRLRRTAGRSDGFHMRHLALAFLCIVILLTMVACDGDSGQNMVNDAQGEGQVVIGLTDAQGDFFSYTVDVVSLTLTRATGVVVQTLPLETRIDFSQYAEMTEFLTAATVTPGVYTRATMVLRFRENDALTADIRVEGPSGDAVLVDRIVDENGNRVDTIEVSVELENQNALWVRPGIPAHLTLDFDLQASNAIEFDEQAVPELTVLPVLLAEVNPVAPKIHRLRGPLKSVDTGAGTFELIIRPFYHPLSDKRVHFGVQAVEVADDTVFDINGETYVGRDGLAELAAQPVLTAVKVLGNLNTQNHSFQATEVSAGSSVPGGTLDVVQGNVVQREGDEIVVKGATLFRSNGSVVFNDTVVVRLGDATRVRRQLSADPLGLDDISVGQRVTVFGSLAEDTMQLDARQGAVCMQLTTLRGTVVTNSAPLTLALGAIDHRSIEGFDFSGTGNDPAADADPEAYTVGTGELDLSAYRGGTPVKIRGFVSPFGHLPGENDFEARTIMDVSRVRAVLHADWRPASTQAIENLSNNGFTLNLVDDHLGSFHHLLRRGVATDLEPYGTAVHIIPATDENNEKIGIFSITQHQVQQTFFSFDNFEEELSERLNEGASIRWIKASGSFDDTTGTLTANWIRIKIKPIPFHAAEVSAVVVQP